MIKLNSDVALTNDIVKKIIDNHKQYEMPRLQKLEDYYLAKNEILKRQMVDSTKPNNRIANPYANYITDTLTGYFMGEPITYSAIDDSIVEELNLIFEYNDEADENVELARSCSIFGVGYEMLYVDIDGNIRFKRLDAKECIPVYDDTIENELLYFVRYYLDKDIATDKEFMWIEVIDKEKTMRYKATNTGSNMELIEEIPHYFNMVPIAIYKNNEEEVGDFENVISLIDAYDKLESDSLNDFEYFCDAYLALIGFTADADDVAQMKENRVLLLDKDTDAKWLIKDEQDSTVENLKTRIDKDIHKFSKCPNLADENFAANASGVAIKYKMVGTENLIAVKERKFKRGLQRRLELISIVQNIKLNQFDWRAVDIIFTRNLPTNDTEIASMVNTLSNIVSTETLLAQIPFVEDIQAEMERLEKEKENNPFYDMRLGLPGEGEENDGSTQSREEAESKESLQ
jgi:SPP1 family phage portal protein